MPKGRKKSPQDSIDSILLAISRRENIDPELMSHYFDRLDEEWTQGAREKVLRLLRTSDPAAHTAAVLILSELATEFDLEEIEDVVADPTVSDLAKLSLAPTLKELRSEMADEVLMEYLNDPEIGHAADADAPARTDGQERTGRGNSAGGCTFHADRAAAQLRRVAWQQLRCTRRQNADTSVRDWKH